MPCQNEGNARENCYRSQSDGVRRQLIVTPSELILANGLRNKHVKRCRVVDRNYSQAKEEYQHRRGGENDGGVAACELKLQVAGLQIQGDDYLHYS